MDSSSGNRVAVDNVVCFFGNALYLKFPISQVIVSSFSFISKATHSARKKSQDYHGEQLVVARLVRAMIVYGSKYSMEIEKQGGNDMTPISNMSRGNQTVMMRKVKGQGNRFAIQYIPANSHAMGSDHSSQPTHKTGLVNFHQIIFRYL